MKQSFKKNILFVLSLSLFQVVVTTPYVWAVENTGTPVKPSPSMGAVGSVARDARMGNHPATIEGNKDMQRVGLPDNQIAQQVRQDNRQEASCERMTALGKDDVQNFSVKKQNFGEKFDGKATGFEDKRDVADAALNGMREKQDEKRNEMYMRLEDAAAGDVAKLAALEDFKKTVESAVSDHRDAIDAATSDFRKSVDALISNKKTDVSTAIDTFQTAMDVSFKKAEIDCANKADPKIVRDILTTNMKDARKKLQESRIAFEKISGSIPSLAEEKRVTMNKAMQDFTTTMEKARVDLKTVFGK